MKEISSDGSILVTTPQCTFLFKRIRVGAMLMTITGPDAGEFGPATRDEIRSEISRHRPLELFIDASNAISASLEVSREWTQFFSDNQKTLNACTY